MEQLLQFFPRASSFWAWPLGTLVLINGCPSATKYVHGTIPAFLQTFLSCFSDGNQHLPQAR